MIPYPNISPEIIRIGPFAVRWYGMMYLFGFVSSYLLVKHQIRKKKMEQEYPPAFLESLYTHIIIGLLVGARLGYVLFYNSSFYLQHPLDIVAVWHGGLSFHGGLIGSILAGILCCRKYRKDPWQVADLIMVTAPIGIGFGRLGNFINGELWGRVTNVPWAMVFPDGGALPRHPSQLYELFLEGIVLFSILWILKDRGFRPGILTSLFLMLYGLFRIFIEFFRQPDPQVGFIAGMFTMGQLLSAAMVAAGAGIQYLRRKQS